MQHAVQSVIADLLVVINHCKNCYCWLSLTISLISLNNSVAAYTLMPFMAAYSGGFRVYLASWLQQRGLTSSLTHYRSIWRWLSQPITWQVQKPSLPNQSFISKPGYNTKTWTTVAKKLPTYAHQTQPNETKAWFRSGTFYAIWPGNGSGLFFSSQGPYGTLPV